jgi:hypothetical protein
LGDAADVARPIIDTMLVVLSPALLSFPSRDGRSTEKKLSRALSAWSRTKSNDTPNVSPRHLSTSVCRNQRCPACSSRRVVVCASKACSSNQRTPQQASYCSVPGSSSQILSLTACLRQSARLWRSKRHKSEPQSDGCCDLPCEILQSLSRTQHGQGGSIHM